MHEARYHLCPRCGRAVPSAAPERFCVNDGTPLLRACPRCGAAIASPHARHCGACGLAYHDATAATADAHGFPGRDP